jgi:nucleotide-binding universal stress UspA family protein
MISKILIAVDGSNHSLKGVEYGAEIAAAIKARVILLNVVKKTVIPESLREFAKAEHIYGMDIDLLKRGAQFMLDKALDSVRRAEVKNVEFEVEEGPVARTIVARAKHHRVDMIVIGSRGMGDIEGALRGGVSHRVGILANCPVLVVK